MAEQHPKRVMIIAGEASGDLHAGNLVAAARRMDPSIQFYGIGGTRMRSAGVEIIVDSSELAVMGLVEVLIHYRRLKGILRRIQGMLRSNPPDLLILTDYPGFNLRLAKTAKALGIKVLYYISPQVWAWREHRVKTIGERVDMMAVVFPFEVPFYEKAGIPVSFVGHPLVDEVHPAMSREQAQRHLGIDPQRQTVGLFPGSRRGEVKRLMPVIIATAKRLKEKHPELQFILPLASSLERNVLTPFLKDSGLEIIVVEHHNYDVMQVCDAIVTASGTATLEIALIGTPMAVIYKVSPLTYTIVSRMLKIAHVGLVNIVAGERIVPEFIQHEAEPKAVAAAVERMLMDAVYATEMRHKLTEVKRKLGSGGGSENVARLALELLKD